MAIRSESNNATIAGIMTNIDPSMLLCIAGIGWFGQLHINLQRFCHQGKSLTFSAENSF